MSFLTKNVAQNLLYFLKKVHLPPGIWNQFLLEHDAVKHMFFMEVENAKIALFYSKTGDVFRLEYIKVPPNLQRRGFGRILAKETFKYIAMNNYKMSISCRFIKKIFEENKGDYKQFYIE
ncbi:hypothetical protein PPYR_05940 [Photinus pyralis]|uniref:Protein NATD1 n=1 Tax=Photinus pyralis TaxID=7054 RepID=A0A5N4ASI5_PHOPY|nr:hypothetical protein PPYR_05940 [Photinus pyralis]